MPKDRCGSEGRLQVIYPERSCVSSGGFEVTDAWAGQLLAGALAKPIMVIPRQVTS